MTDFDSDDPVRNLTAFAAEMSRVDGADVPIVTDIRAVLARLERAEGRVAYWMREALAGNDAWIEVVAERDSARRERDEAQNKIAELKVRLERAESIAGAARALVAHYLSELQWTMTASQLQDLLVALVKEVQRDV